VAEAVRKRGGSTLELSKDPFDSVPISVATHLKPEARSLQCGLVVLSADDQEHGGFDIVFFSQFAEEDLSECGRGRRKELDVKQVICFGVCSGEQPESLVIDPNLCFVEGDLIRALACVGL
jgi:hypothetical protein